MVAIGLGIKNHLTFGAYEYLCSANHIYIMAQPDSWMVKFVAEITGKNNIRTYMPETVKWGSGWHNDPIFEEIADEVAALIAKGEDVAFAMAGDVSIYGNVADSIVPIFRKRGMDWDVYPGVSFLNALSIETGDPIVGEQDRLSVASVKTAEEMDAHFETTNVVVLYNPKSFSGLREYIKDRGFTYAKMVIHGVYGSPGKLVDLTQEEVQAISGLVILRQPASVAKSIEAQLAGNKRAQNIQNIEYHLGLNGWDSKGRFFAVLYPDSLVWAPDGNCARLQQRFKFPDRQLDIRGFFVDSRNRIFIGLKGFQKEPFGRTYLSQDGGKSFEIAFNQCFWGMDEDKFGNLYAGIYHERGEPDSSCSVLWSGDGGFNWVNIAAPSWVTQLHVHHLAIDPQKGWVYACLGDEPGLRGCWRMKPGFSALARPAAIGDTELDLITPLPFDSGDMIVTSTGQRLTVNSSTGSKVRLTEKLDKDLPEGIKVIKAKWILKIANSENTVQFIGICFKKGTIFLSDDTGPRHNPERNIVYRAEDNGEDTLYSPEPVLKAEKESGWGGFFLECDRYDRIWTAVRPVSGKGAVWVSTNGFDWTKTVETLAEDIPCWRGTHTFRDATIGQTGSGASLSGPKGEMVVPYLNRALVLGIVA
jgi:precorrin-2 methylase